jgi:hypothetical protein
MDKLNRRHHAVSLSKKMTGQRQLIDAGGAAKNAYSCQALKYRDEQGDGTVCAFLKAQS